MLATIIGVKGVTFTPFNNITQAGIVRRVTTLVCQIDSFFNLENIESLMKGLEVRIIC